MTTGTAARPLEFGLFDWIDQRPADVDQIYRERLELLEYADEAGFFCYHLAEHHATPLSLVPSPGIFLAAASQRTRRIRLGPLVYLLPLYNPLRLLKEVAMLDNLSGGRVELGVGRGVSPYELGYYGVDAQETRSIFLEALEVMRAGFTTDRLTFHGKYYHFDDVPIEIHCRQQPYPALWYPTSSLDSVPWAAQQGLHLMGQAGVKTLRAASERYWEVWPRHSQDPGRLNAHVSSPRVGVLRMVHLAPTDEQARETARPAYRDWFTSFNLLWRAFGNTTYEERGDFETAQTQGALIVGSPETVRTRLARLVEESGCNYVVLAFAWGTLTHEQALRSLRLFAEEVRPAFAGAASDASRAPA